MGLFWWSCFSQPLKALAVDDEIAIRRFLRPTLIAESFDVEEAGGVVGSLGAASWFQFDLAVPEMGLLGWQRG